MALPRHFCWTRFGTEAGESINDILLRKDDERKLNGGVFLWGIGNAIGPSVRELIRRVQKPEVIFSPIRSAPRKIDVLPAQVAVWTWGETLMGESWELPAHSVVTSRFDKHVGQRGRYALVCSVSSPLEVSDTTEKVLFGALRNLLSGRPIGTTQVTAVVSRTVTAETGPEYKAVIRASLIYPYLVRLRGPVVVSSKSLTSGNLKDRSELLLALKNASKHSHADLMHTANLAFQE